MEKDEHGLRAGVEKAGWTGSDGDRHALVLFDFLPYPVQFANNCHRRSHEVEAAAGTHRTHRDLCPSSRHTGAVWRAEAAPSTLQPWLQRGDT